MVKYIIVTIISILGVLYWKRKGILGKDESIIFLVLSGIPFANIISFSVVLIITCLMIGFVIKNFFKKE